MYEIINSVCQLLNIEVKYIRHLYTEVFLSKSLFSFLKCITILISPILLNYLNSVTFINTLTSATENLVFCYGLFIILQQGCVCLASLVRFYLPRERVIIQQQSYSEFL